MFCINSQQVIHVVNILCDTIVKMFPADTRVHNSAAADPGGKQEAAPPLPSPQEKNGTSRGEYAHSHTRTVLFISPSVTL